MPGILYIADAFQDSYILDLISMEAQMLRDGNKAEDIGTLNKFLLFSNRWRYQNCVHVI